MTCIFDYLHKAKEDQMARKRRAVFLGIVGCVVAAAIALNIFGAGIVSADSSQIAAPRIVDQQQGETNQIPLSHEAAFRCQVACNKCHNSCRIGNGPNYNKKCMAQCKAADVACCTGASRTSIYPICGCRK